MILKIADIKSNLQSVRHINNEICNLRHGKTDSKIVNWVEYEPTRFMYHFIMFNTLYNIYFPKSLKTGKLEKHPLKTVFQAHNQFSRNLTEKEQISEMIKFCLHDHKFCNSYASTFINTLCSIHTFDDIIEKIGHIKPDKAKRKNIRLGNVYLSMTACV